VIRRCDGTDPNLKRERRPEDSPHVEGAPYPGLVSCDCGMTFDDVRRSTIHPHREV
jgi:hypothetical protein